MNITRFGRTVHKAMPTENSQLYSLNSQFSGKTYLAGLCERDGKDGYLFLAGGDVRSRVAFVKPELKAEHLVVRDVDGCPTTAVKVSSRNLKAMLRARSVTEFYGSLGQWLTEGDIKNFFYDIWMRKHNYEAIKEQRREENRIRNGGKPSSRGRYVGTSRWG